MQGIINLIFQGTSLITVLPAHVNLGHIQALEIAVEKS